MDFYRITNDGMIVQGAMTLLGASTKEGAGKIGFFGSGNKYAIATLLREGIEFRIYSGTHFVPVGTRPVEFGGESFEQIIVDGEATSFTTRMGPDWKVWYALREFVANAIDEGGFSCERFSIEVPDELAAFAPDGQTSIFVELNTKTQDFFENSSRYFLAAKDNERVIAEVESPYSGKTRMLHHREGDSQLNVYRKGISVRHPGDEKSLYEYDIEDLDINESRVYCYEYELRAAMAAALAAIEDPEEVRAAIAASSDRGLFEGYADWEVNGIHFSNAWREVLAGAYIVPEDALSFLPPEDVSRACIVRDTLFEALKVAFPDFHYFGKKGNAIPTEASEELKEKIAEGVNFVHEFGFEFGGTIEYARFTNNDLVAQFTHNNGEQLVTVSVDHLAEMKPDDVASMLIEEFSHSLGYGDGTRSLETYLCNQIVRLGRELHEKEVAGAKLEALKNLVKTI